MRSLLSWPSLSKSSEDENWLAAHAGNLRPARVADPEPADDGQEWNLIFDDLSARTNSDNPIRRRSLRAASASEEPGDDGDGSG